MSFATGFLKRHWFDSFDVARGRTPSKDDRLIETSDRIVCSWCGAEGAGYVDRRPTQMGCRCQDCMVFSWQHPGHGVGATKTSSLVHAKHEFPGYVIVSESSAIRLASGKPGAAAAKKGKTLSHADILRNGPPIWSEVIGMEGVFDLPKVLDRLSTLEPPFVVFSVKNKAGDVAAGLRVTFDKRNVHLFDDAPYVFDLPLLRSFLDRAREIEDLPDWPASRKGYWRVRNRPEAEKSAFLETLSEPVRAFYDALFSRKVLDDTPLLLNRVLSRKKG